MAFLKPQGGVRNSEDQRTPRLAIAATRGNSAHIVNEAFRLH